jgi:hypothetical protein
LSSAILISNKQEQLRNISKAEKAQASSDLWKLLNDTWLNLNWEFQIWSFDGGPVILYDGMVDALVSNTCAFIGIPVRPVEAKVFASTGPAPGTS